MSDVHEEMSPDVAPVRPGEEVDEASLRRFLLVQFPDLDGEISVLQFPRGSANLTYRVSLGDRKFVVRRPPMGQIASGAHDMAREHRVLSRLYTEYDRAPRSYVHCADPGVIGAEFFVSEYRVGHVVWDHVPAAVSTASDAVARVGFAVVDALADLHEVDPEKCGLGDLGRPEGFLERQVAGWTRRWDAVADQLVLPDADRIRKLVDELGGELARRRPRSQRAGIVHNDFKIDNCQFAEGNPDRVSAVFDWDMATLGDTLADFGTLLSYWPDSSLPAGDARAFVAASATRELDLPPRSEVVERYARSSTADLSEIAWYEAFGCWRTVVILQQLYARHVRGESTDARMAQRGLMVEPLAQRGLAVLTDRS